VDTNYSFLPGTRKCDPDSEPQLVSRAQNGEEAAFAALFNAHKKRVYTLCLRMVGEVAEAEDLTQDAFIQAFRKLASFRGDSAFSTWLYRIAVNTVLMKLRQRKPQQVSYDEPICVNSSLLQREYGCGDPQLLGVVDRIVLTRAIQDLPEGYRTIFILHDVEGYDHSEIAELMNCSTGNSKSQLHKARMKIREFLLAQPAVAKKVQATGRKSKAARSRSAFGAPGSPAQPQLATARGAEDAKIDLRSWQAQRGWELCGRQAG
jgi:RNA polymerase sigma-70 factor (ECF subfamily)